MFNESMKGISVLSYALLNSANDIIESNTHTQVSTDRSQFVSNQGDIYFPMSAKLQLDSSNPEKKVPTFMVDGNETELNFIDFRSFRNQYLADGITTISYNKSVFLPTLLKRLAQEKKTYGIIIQKGSYIINPLHPLVAFSVTSGLMHLPEEGELHIFEWNSQTVEKLEADQIPRNTTRKEFYTSEYQKVFGLFRYLIKESVVEKRTAFISDDDINKLVDAPLLDDINVNITVDVSSESDRGSDNIKSIIVPTQLAIGDMATPYYGLMLLKKPNTDISGYNLTPMMSGNLNQGMCSSNRFRNLLGSTSSGNVCTGSESSNSPRGWSTLSKINLNSMFQDELVSTTGVVSFVEASKEIASSIWERVEKEDLAALDSETSEEPEALDASDSSQQRTVTVG